MVFKTANPFAQTVTHRSDTVKARLRTVGYVLEGVQRSSLLYLL